MDPWRVWHLMGVSTTTLLSERLDLTLPCSRPGTVCCVCVCLCVCVCVCVCVTCREILEKGEVNVSIQSYHLYSEANRLVLKILMLLTPCLKLGPLL